MKVYRSRTFGYLLGPRFWLSISEIPQGAYIHELIIQDGLRNTKDVRIAGVSGVVLSLTSCQRLGINVSRAWDSQDKPMISDALSRLTKPGSFAIPDVVCSFSIGR